MRDSDNLPPGTAGCDLPGNSRKDMAATAAMEDADVLVNGIAVELHELSEKLDVAFDGDTDDAQRAVKLANDTLENIQVKLETACDILCRVTDG